jgi:hypothetical protein
VELPERLIRLYTFRDDLVLDPFMGSGSTLVAAARVGRRYAGYDLDEAYVDVARARVAALAPQPLDFEDFQARASLEGKAVRDIAERVLETAGFTIVGRNHRFRGLGLDVAFIARDGQGTTWYFDVSGAFTTTRGGLGRTDAVWRCLGRAHVLAHNGVAPVVVLTSHLPRRGSGGDAALRAAGLGTFFDAVEMLSDAGRDRLGMYARGGHHQLPLPGFWAEQDVAGPT